MTVSVPMVELGLLNSVEEATPVGPMVNTLTPVEEAIVKRFPVWLVAPLILREVEATVCTWINNADVFVADGASARAVPRPLVKLSVGKVP